MHTLNESFTDQEWQTLKEAKGKLTWREYLMKVSEALISLRKTQDRDVTHTAFGDVDKATDGFLLTWRMKRRNLNEIKYYSRWKNYNYRIWT